jgi:hypothetical protein
VAHFTLTSPVDPDIIQATTGKTAPLNALRFDLRTVYRVTGTVRIEIVGLSRGRPLPYLQFDMALPGYSLALKRRSRAFAIPQRRWPERHTLAGTAAVEYAMTKADVRSWNWSMAGSDRAVGDLPRLSGFR